MLPSFTVLHRHTASARAIGCSLATLLLAAAVVTGCNNKGTGSPARSALPAEAKNPVVVMTTTKGTIEIELDQNKAPISVKNFLDYVDTGHYDGTIFHRVIKDFMIQCGGFTAAGLQKPTKPPIRNEASNGLKNLRGTVAMARTSVVDSATSQFFINQADNAFLDYKDSTPQGYGYAVFGKVVSGMDVVDAIASAPKANKGGAFTDRPVEDIVIQSIKRKN